MRLPASFILAALFVFSLQSQQLNYYFGNIHSHTGFSDGNKDSVTSGVSDPDGSYAYARLSDNFDFLGISEHNHYSSKGNPGFKRHLYQQGLAMAAVANDDHNFLALFGMEYGVSSQYNGHVLIYGLGQLLGWEETVPGVSGANYDVFNAKTDYAGLFKKINAAKGAFCYLAHPGFDDFSTDGTWNTALANAPYNAGFDSAIVGMPLRSGLATNSGSTYSDYPQGNYFNYYKKMLYNGYHLGIGYDHDNHFTNFGRGNGGRLVIMAPELTRPEFYEAMFLMRFYGSDDSNARINFICNGQVMGSIVTDANVPVFTVTHDDPDGEQADSIKIWKGSKNSGGLWSEIVHITVGNNTAVFSDENLVAEKEYFYFAEIKQGDGQWIVTSPIWFTRSLSSGTKMTAAVNASIHYNPLQALLHLGLDYSGEHKFLLCDVQGKVVLERNFSGTGLVVDVSELAAGVYVSVTETTRGAVIKKVVIN